jgi:hypothetical protein
MSTRPPPITDPAITAVRFVAPVVVFEGILMTVGMRVVLVMVDEPITVTKDEVMVDVVRPPYVEVGVVEVGLF